MKKRVKYLIFTAKAVRQKEGRILERPLKDVKYAGRKLTQVGKEKLFKEQLLENEKVVIIKEEEKIDVYEYDINLIINHAKKIN